jgi:hypothetical protein
VAVPVDRTGTASVEPVMAPPVQGVQKPPRQEGKRFQDRLEAAPKREVKRPAGLKTRPWARTQWSAMATRAARLGIRSHAGLEAADDDDLVPGPNSDDEGAGSAAQNNVGAVIENPF